MSYTHFCPVCEGAADTAMCYCDGRGIVTAEEAKDFMADGMDAVVEIVELPAPPAEMPRPCHDCAFGKGSEERASLKTWGAIMRGVAEGEPFWCHQGMATDCHGFYVPLDKDAAGRPVGHPICAGWLAERARSAPEAT